MKAVMLEDADTGCARICGNQSLSMTSTWSRVFRYFSLQMRAIKVRWSNSILQRNNWSVMTLHTDDPLNDSDETISPLC